jgi:hypothetical protein
VHYKIASVPGSPDRENEDWAAVAGDAVVVIDGSGLPGNMPTGCIHGVPWYVRNLGIRLLAGMTDPNPRATLPDVLAAAIGWVTHLHSGTCDISSPGTPSAVLAMARPRAGTLEYLVLGDCTFGVTHRNSEVSEVADHRMDQVAAEAFRAMLAVPLGDPGKLAARVAFVREQAPLRNRPGGYPLAGSVPEAAYEACTGSIPLADCAEWVLMTDGAARYMDFGVGAIRDAMTLLGAAGPEGLFREVREAEAADPAGERLPRGKASDDATVAYSPRVPVPGG